MADEFKKAINKQVGPGGIKCSCCYPVGRKDKAKVTRRARRVLKQAINQEGF